jgi:catecholate siderophore receptor
MTIRESFAIEQVEISKGANSSFAGRGTAGGAINAITKQAMLDYDFTRLGVSLGTSSHTRLTADINKAFSDTFALRANVLSGDEGVPARSPATRERQGLAMSGLWKLSPQLSVTLDYYGMRGGDTYPDLGTFLRGTPPNRFPVAGTPVFAQAQDFLNSNVDTVTARIKYKFSPDMSLTSLTRYGTSNNGYVITGANNANANLGTAASAFVTGSLSTHTGWQEVEYFAHQTNLRLDKVIAGMKNEFIFGVQYTDQKVLKGTYGVTNTGAFNCRVPGNGQPAAGAVNAYCLTLASGAPVANLNNLLNRSITRAGWNNDWQVKTIALSAMDTVDITDRLTAFGGIRLDRFDYSLSVGTNGVQTAAYGYKDTLTNDHFGLSFKINPAVMVYGSVASSADINGGESDVGLNSGYGGAIIVNGSIATPVPEKSRNLELGTKWNILDDKLLLTAAVFCNTKSGVIEGNGYTSTGTANSGKNRVQGVELGLTGNIAERLSAQAGIAFLKSRVLQSATPANVGLPLSNFADKSYSAQVKYQFTPELYLGVAARHESERCAPGSLKQPQGIQQTASVPRRFPALRCMTRSMLTASTRTWSCAPTC